MDTLNGRAELGAGKGGQAAGSLVPLTGERLLMSMGMGGPDRLRGES